MRRWDESGEGGEGVIGGVLVAGRSIEFEGLGV
jgi:hypothetical protein